MSSPGDFKEFQRKAPGTNFHAEILLLNRRFLQFCQFLDTLLSVS